MVGGRRPAKRARTAAHRPAPDPEPEQASSATTESGEIATGEQPASSSQPQHHDFVFDDEGDLTLIVGEGDEQKRMKVCSRTLARLSPVFKRMLFGGWAESRPASSSQHWEVELPDDFWGPTHWAMYIVHGDFESVSKLKLGLAELYAFLVFTNKYDMTASLRPWAENWLSPINRIYRDPHLLLVSWELGSQALFSQSAKKIAYSCREDPDDQRLYVKLDRINMYYLDEYEYLVPPHFIETISTFRSKALDKIFGGLDRSWKILSDQELEADEDEIVDECACNPSCHMSFLGVFVTTARKAGLLPYLDMRPAQRNGSTGVAIPFNRPLFLDSVERLLIKIDDVWQMGKRLSHADLKGLRKFSDELESADCIAKAIKEWDFVAEIDAETRDTYMSYLQGQRAKTGVQH